MENTREENNLSGVNFKMVIQIVQAEKYTLLSDELNYFTVNNDHAHVSVCLFPETSIKQFNT